MLRVASLALVLGVAGCIAGVPLGDVVDAIPVQPIVQTHDHTDASLHVGGANLDFVAWAPLIPEAFGEEGFAGMRVVGDLAFIATDGAYAGFLIVDIADAAAPRLVGQYTTPGGASQEAVPNADGTKVFLNLQRRPGPVDQAESVERGHGNGIQVVDVSDPTAPRFESFTPVETYGSHVMFYFEWDGVPHLVYNGQPSRHGLPTGEVYTQPVGNVVHIAEIQVIDGVTRLVPKSEFRYVDALTTMASQGCFPHDMWIEENPVTARLVMYVAHWDCGLVLVDVDDPAAPELLGVYDDLAPSTRNRIHFARPDPTLRDGRVIAYSGPEIDQSPGEPGYVRVYDATDPTDPMQVGSWRLPGDVENDQPYIFTPHNFDFRGDLLAVAHYHAGVWLLDVSVPEAPRAVGYYLPHGDHETPYSGREVWRKTPNFPIAYLPNVYEVKWRDDAELGPVLLVTERGTGLYVLKPDNRLV